MDTDTDMHVDVAKLGYGYCCRDTEIKIDYTDMNTDYYSAMDMD